MLNESFGYCPQCEFARRGYTHENQERYFHNAPLSHFCLTHFREVVQNVLHEVRNRSQLGMFPEECINLDSQEYNIPGFRPPEDDPK